MNNSFLVLPHLKIQNANALSSPVTIGFPAMTAWLGAVHALQRHLQSCGMDITFEGVGVASHDFQLQTYKGPGDFVASIVGTANPLDKDGERSSFVEEPRCDLTVSLVTTCSEVKPAKKKGFIHTLKDVLRSRMKFAGGDLLDFEEPILHQDFSCIKRQLMPGYVLIERRELVREAMEQGEDPLDAILDYIAVHHRCEPEQDSNEVIWQSNRKPTDAEGNRGWIVPIATGFHGISDLNHAKNQRDPHTPHRFAEAVVTLGEFKMAYRLNDPSELLWYHEFQASQNLYLCRQEVQSNIDVGF